MNCLFNLLIISAILTSCGDSYSRYITSITNNTNYEFVVQLFEDTTIICHSYQETIIEDKEGSSLKEMSCETPYIFSNGHAQIIIDSGNKTLSKDILADSNWACDGEEDWNLIMVGSYYSKIKTTFTVNPKDIKDAE